LDPVPGPTKGAKLRQIVERFLPHTNVPMMNRSKITLGARRCVRENFLEGVCGRHITDLAPCQFSKVL
jgi:hypothetical protein